MYVSSAYSRGRANNDLSGSAGVVALRSSSSSRSVLPESKNRVDNQKFRGVKLLAAKSLSSMMLRIAPKVLRGALWKILVFCDKVRARFGRSEQFCRWLVEENSVPKRYLARLAAEKPAERLSALKLTVIPDYLTQGKAISSERLTQLNLTRESYQKTWDDAILQSCELEDFSRDLSRIKGYVELSGGGPYIAHVISQSLRDLSGENTYAEQREFIRKAKEKFSESKMERLYNCLVYRDYLVRNRSGGGREVEILRDVSTRTVRRAREILLEFEELLDNESLKSLMVEIS
jgi:hypothetical protein